MKISKKCLKSGPFIYIRRDEINPYIPGSNSSDFRGEVRRMTSYLALLKDAILYYRDHQIQVKFEAEETFVYSAKGKKVTGEAKPLPFTGHNFPVLTLTDEEVLEELRNSEYCSMEHRKKYG